MIRYSLPYPPTVNTLFDNRKGGRVKSEGYQRWIRAAQGAILEQGRKRLHGPVSLAMALVRPDKRRRDLSNTIKAVEDLLVSMAVIDDDSLVQRISIQWVGAGDPCVVLIQAAEVELAA